MNYLKMKVSHLLKKIRMLKNGGSVQKSRQVKIQGLGLQYFGFVSQLFKKIVIKVVVLSGI
jgi:hypothetical protein